MKKDKRKVKYMNIITYITNPPSIIQLTQID